VLCGHEGDVIAMRISADNYWLLTASNDKRARLWFAVNDLADLYKSVG
jgi:WD40 repeat protein